MNSWYVSFIYLALLIFFASMLLISVIVLIVKLVNKKPKKIPAIHAAASAALLTATISFIVTHPTYYKYNDYSIIGSTVASVQNKYGEFDLSTTYRQGKSGWVAYYIYHDSGPIMPDHLDHYYYMYYDENGIIYEVCDSCQPGG